MFIYGQSLAGAHRIVGMSFYPLHNDFTPSYFLLSIVIGVTATHLERKGMTAEASHLTKSDRLAQNLPFSSERATGKDFGAV